MKPLRIAMLTAKFDPGGSSPFLVDDLAEALLSMGHTVDVFYVDWARAYVGQPTIRRDKMEVHVIEPAGGERGLLERVLKWAFSGFKVSRFYRQNFPPHSHDLLISFSPSIVFSVVLLQLKTRIKTRALVQWDFFPFHQAQIGLIPFRWMTSLAATIETALLNSFTTISCMSPKNVAYLHEHYKIDREIRTGVLPIWSKVRPKPQIDRELVRKGLGIPHDSFVAVFGGQITAGRGIEDIVEMAIVACQRSSRVRFLVIGSGPKTEWLIARSKELSGYLLVSPPMPRDSYLTLIAACDVGLVLTVPNVDVPSFPSKTLDYCCVGIPVAAAVESSTDYGEIIAAVGFGRYCEAGNPSALFEILEQLSSDPTLCESMGASARERYETYFNVDNVAMSLVRMAQDV